MCSSDLWPFPDRVSAACRRRTVSERMPEEQNLPAHRPRENASSRASSHLPFLVNTCSGWVLPYSILFTCASAGKEPGRGPDYTVGSVDNSTPSSPGGVLSFIRSTASTTQSATTRLRYHLRFAGTLVHYGRRLDKRSSPSSAHHYHTPTDPKMEQPGGRTNTLARRASL